MVILCAVGTKYSSSPFFLITKVKSLSLVLIFFDCGFLKMRFLGSAVLFNFVAIQILNLEYSWSYYKLKLICYRFCISVYCDSNIRYMELNFPFSFKFTPGLTAHFLPVNHGIVQNSLKFNVVQYFVFKNYYFFKSNS